MRLTRFEEARLVGARALQLSGGAPALVKPEKIVSVIEIAQKELAHDALPLRVLRKEPAK